MTFPDVILNLCTNYKQARFACLQRNLKPIDRVLDCYHGADFYYVVSIDCVIINT